MPCPTLNLSPEIFGAPIEDSLPGAQIRGLWYGLPHAAGSQVSKVLPVGVGGLVVTVVTSMSASGDRLTVSIQNYGAAGSADYVRPFGSALNVVRGCLLAASNFVVVHCSSTPTGAPATDGDCVYLIFDLRPALPGVSAPRQPVMIGPLAVPHLNEFFYCPSKSGQLALVYDTGVAPEAAVYRTDRQEPNALLQADLANYPGLLACAITGDATNGFFLALFNGAQPAGTAPTNTVNVTPTQVPFVTGPAPAGGPLLLSSSSVHIGSAPAESTVTATNSGLDYLELTNISVTPPSNLVFVAFETLSGSAITLPACLAPGQACVVRVRRVGVAAAPAAVLAVKIATEPPASAATLTVDVDAVSATPAVSVLPTSMTWNAGNAAKQPLGIVNTGNTAVDFEVDSPTSTSRFVWTGVPATKLDPGQSWSPPIDVGVKANSSPGTERITVRAVLAGTSMPEAPRVPGASDADRDCRWPTIHRGGAVVLEPAAASFQTTEAGASTDRAYIDRRTSTVDRGDGRHARRCGGHRRFGHRFLRRVPGCRGQRRTGRVRSRPRARRLARPRRRQIRVDR